MNKRGQAALEFMMTYGWAILAAIIAIGILAYFGVFSPGKYVTGNAIIEAPFYIETSLINSSGVYLDLLYNGGYNIIISNISVDFCGENTTPISLNDGSNQLIVIPCDLSGNIGETKKGEISIAYTRSEGVLSYDSAGTITGKVIA
jgi:hypothetical protein